MRTEVLPIKEKEKEEEEDKNIPDTDPTDNSNNDNNNNNNTPPNNNDGGDRKPEENNISPTNNNPVKEEPSSKPVIKTNTKNKEIKKTEPETGDTSHIVFYSYLIIISILSYFLLSLLYAKGGITEERKQEILGTFIKWGKNSHFKRYAALIVIFLFLAYYHSIGKCADFGKKEVCEE